MGYGMIPRTMEIKSVIRNKKVSRIFFGDKHISMVFHTVKHMNNKFSFEALAPKSYLSWH